MGPHAPETPIRAGSVELRDDGRPPEDWRGQPRTNDTHESTSDPESRLYCKSHAAPALPSYLGQLLTDNRHGLVVNVQASTSDGTVEHATWLRRCWPTWLAPASG